MNENYKIDYNALSTLIEKVSKNNEEKYNELLKHVIVCGDKWLTRAEPLMNNMLRMSIEDRMLLLIPWTNLIDTADALFDKYKDTLNLEPNLDVL